MFLTIMFMFTSFISMVMITVNTPLTMSITIIFTTFLISIFTNSFLLSPWLPFILLMIFITGMMIIFLYISALTTNIVNITEITPYYLIIPFIMIYTFTLLMNPFNTNNMHNYMNLTSLSPSSLLVYKLFSPQMATITILMMIYLLIALFVVIKNTSNTNYPLQLKS